MKKRTLIVRATLDHDTTKRFFAHFKPEEIKTRKRVLIDVKDSEYGLYLIVKVTNLKTGRTDFQCIFTDTSEYSMQVIIEYMIKAL